MTKIKTEESVISRTLTHAWRAAGRSPLLPPVDGVDGIADRVEDELAAALTCLGFADTHTITAALRRGGVMTHVALILIRALDLRDAPTLCDIGRGDAEGQ